MADSVSRIPSLWRYFRHNLCGCPCHNSFENITLGMKLGRIIFRFFNRNAGGEPDANAGSKKIALIALSAVMVEVCVIMVLKTTDKMPQSAMGIDKTIGHVGYTGDGLDLKEGPYDLEALPGSYKPKLAKKLGEVTGGVSSEELTPSGAIISERDSLATPETLLSVWDTIGQNINMVSPPGHQDWCSPYQPLQN